SHGAAVVVALGAASAVGHRVARRALSGVRVEAWRSTAWHASGAVVSGAIGTLNRWMTRAYPTMRRDAWLPCEGTAMQRLLALRAITHAFPPWVPLLGQEHPTCGQQTWFLSRGWVVFTLAALVQATPLLVLVAAIGWYRLRGPRSQYGAGLLAT